MKFPEAFRETGGAYGTNRGDEFGLFFVPTKKMNTTLKVLAAPSDSEWQHVSVSIPSRIPTWNEMNMVKDLFWDEEDTVVQFHPKKSEYVNNCKTCLHLWMYRDGHVLPPKYLVGV